MVDVNSLTLGDVTATGNLNAKAEDDLVLNGNVSADTLDLTATNGKIDQTAGQLSVVTGPTNLNAASDINLGSATNDFNGTVNAAGNNIALVDGTGGLTLGDITAGGTFDVTSTDGAIDQANGTTIAVTDETTLVASDGADPATTYDIRLDGANNDFATVNADGAAITLVDVNSLTLGDVTATGKLDATAATDLVLNGDVSADRLDLTATDGKIDQTGGELSVVNGPTNLNASADITLASATNDFNGLVNAGGINITLVDVGALALGVVTAMGNLDLTSTGDLVLGTVTVAGGLVANSNGGSITQTGPLRVEGEANLNAGSGVVDLSNPDNYFPSGVNAKGSSVTVAGDSNLVNSQVSAGVFYQEVTREEFAVVWVADSFSSSIVTTDVLVVSEADEQQIKMSLCMSSPVSADLTCVSD